MKNNNKDTFEGIVKKAPSNNFFMNESSFSKPDALLFSSEPLRRLNDYDSNLLEEDAYKDVDDDLFKLEYKLYKLEENIKALTSQIQAAQEIGDGNLAEEFFIRKLNLEREYQNLLEVYNTKSLSAKLSDKVFNLFGQKFKKKYKNHKSKISSFYKQLLGKLPKQLTSILELRNSLTKLENLNKNVDELISMNIPYGENIDKYEQLSKYIIKANSIQGEISKFIKK